MTTQIAINRVIIHPVVKRSVVIAGHKTSLSLEEPFWKQLQGMARRSNRTLAAFVAGIDRDRIHGNLSSAVRQLVLADALAKPAVTDTDRQGEGQ